MLLLSRKCRPYIGDLPLFKKAGAMVVIRWIAEETQR
jgi:hypothetical protein